MDEFTGAGSRPLPLRLAGGGRVRDGPAGLACGAHHGMLEHGHHRVMIDGVPHVIPPPWIDPHQQPVRNTYWHDQATARQTGRQLALDLQPRPPPARERPPDTG